MKPAPPYIPCYRRLPLRFTAGRGCRLEAEDGRVFLDFLSGIGVNALGHAHPALSAALADQAGRLLHVSNLYDHPWGAELAERLAKATGLDLVFFTNSGAEAVETALKLARRATGRGPLVALEGAFHGRSFGALSVTANPAYREPFAPLVPAVVHVPPDEAALAEALRAEPAAALILEPIQGESGVHPLPAALLRAARRLCDETGALLIHDEIQCGLGRTGTFLAAEAAGVVPDVVLLAKPLGGGLPLGAVVARAAAGRALRPGDHGSTFGGNPAACRLALVVLDELLERGLLARVAEAGRRLRAGLETLARRHARAREVRGRGLMLALELSGPAAPVLARLIELGLLAGSAGPRVLRFLPPYVVSDAEIDEALDLLDRALREAPADEPRSER